jgi:predicted secreted protein
VTDERVRLRPGETHVLRLPGRGLSGYRWEPAVDGSAVDVESAVDRTGEDPPGVGPGAGGAQVFTLRAVEVGRAVVTLTRRRRFGPPEENAETRTLIVDVTDG